MSKHILVAVAWPYANAEIHVGNLTGSYLPADIFARYHRLRGNQVLMVSGSDAHGTPITVKSDAEGVTPVEIYKRYHAGFVELFQKLGLQYDLFTSTHTRNHFKVSQTMFLALKENGYLYTEEQQQWYSASLGKFLPDRYVEGTCYICGFEGARGDQCDNCGNVLDATQLIQPRAKEDGSTPQLRTTTHYFLDLGKLQPEVMQFLETRQSYWRPNVVNRSLGWIRSEGLHGRPITRDLDWGIPLPVQDGDWASKRLYVWFEAVIGYLSAAIEWAALSGEPQAWQRWWTDPAARAYYFIGKDNIDFHAIMWPAELIGVGEQFTAIYSGEQGKPLTLPYDVPANEFLNMENRKISGSRNWGVWGLDFLSRYDADPLRYYLTVNMPESSDANWDWDDFVRRNNNELVATWGNLANRVLSFAAKHWEGRVPQPGALRPQDEALLASIEAGYDSVGQLIENVKLRGALGEAMGLAAEVNRYLDEQAPWTQVKTDKDAAGKTIYTALRAIDNLKLLLAPFLPHTSEALHQMLGYHAPLFGEQYTETVSDDLGEHLALRYRAAAIPGHWRPSTLEGGRALQQPGPLYKKLEPSIADEERARLGGAA
ncbi:MAG: methionine--tRNA ligase [Anaerolineales bacterium]|jgi:methionyl-tRNA synthetase|nr:methionine--tRNA ligase [Anaerolineales bacterium]MCW5838734.1 methionine--tRNA ligase [Anaerolineales bacterium]MCW5888286.1 methionine--tRNA ligase [Anaerolineales bacterium]